jgi:hypothetical protein
MSVNFELGSVRHIPLTALTLSKTGSQTERRAHFDKAAIKELGESIKTVGLLSPIIARVSARIDVVESDGGGRWYPAHKRKAMEGHNLIGGGHKSREAAESEAAALREKLGAAEIHGGTHVDNKAMLECAQSLGRTPMFITTRFVVPPAPKSRSPKR